MEEKGERFPYINPKAEKFMYRLDPEKNELIDLQDSADNLDEALLYTGYLEGIGYIIRHSIELYEDFDILNTKNEVFITGTASRSTEWMQIISDITGKTVIIPAETEYSSAYAGVLFGEDYLVNQREISKLVNHKIKPNADKHKLYTDFYPFFVKLLKKYVK